MFENLTQLNMTSIFIHNWSHRHKHFLLFMTCWNETEKWFVRCIKGDVDTLIFIFWVSEFLFYDYEILLFIYHNYVGDNKFRNPHLYILSTTSVAKSWYYR